MGSDLAGSTILRFAHAFESGGGTERYLDDLDRELLRRNAMTIVRLHLTRQLPSKGQTEERVGQGSLVRVPLPVHPAPESSAMPRGRSFPSQLKQQARDRVLYHPLVWRAVGANWAARLRLPPKPGQAIGAGAAASEALRSRRIDLVMLHFFGGADADEVVAETRRAGVPFAVLNHYSNDRFLHLPIRKHAMLADGVAGVNGLEVPGYIRNRFVNLSDGIDTQFFRRAHAQAPAIRLALPIVLLPARIIREKGQLDLVKAASSLRRSGVECCLAFAGRADSSEFVAELRREIDRAGMTADVQFLGDLSPSELRDWYAASAVVALPTYHHEGLGRVLLEAQAMGSPVVAYATGGVAEAFAPGHTGFLLPTGDIVGLANRLRQLLASPLLCASMGARGREAAENQFSLAALAERHERFYHQVITAFKAGQRINAD